MFEEFLGNYLVKSGKLNREQFTNVKEVMKTARVKLGLIAVSEKLLTSKQADEINRLQAVMDKRFGDIAVEKGYLTDTQVGHLLSLQGNPYMQFVQAITEGGYMTLDEVEACVASYQTSLLLSDEDIAAIKSGDVDKICGVFINTDNILCKDLICLGIRNIVRFISSEISFGSIEKVSEYSYENIATQVAKGDHLFLFAFAGNDTSLLSIASTFAKEEFEVVDADSFDSVCEFINCINGLYASKLSKEDVNIDMEPPLFYTNGMLKADSICKVPMTIAGSNVDLLVVVDSHYTFN
jgi:hypothetical protein